MAKIYKLFCTLNTHVVTEAGDFIPAGTPVQVIQWGKGNTIMVRCSSYMFDSGVEDDTLASYHGSICKGLHIEVDPNNLQYKDSLMSEIEQR